MINIFTRSIAALLITTAMVVAQPVVFVPEGSANTILMVNPETGETINKITGLEAVHGLSGAPGVPYLVAGSYAETDRAAITELTQPEGVTEDDHVAHHSTSEDELIGPTDAGISILSVLDAATGEIIRRIEVPGAVHHTCCIARRPFRGCDPPFRRRDIHPRSDEIDADRLRADGQYAQLRGLRDRPQSCLCVEFWQWHNQRS
jgi:hypothetical protein